MFLFECFRFGEVFVFLQKIKNKINKYKTYINRVKQNRTKQQTWNEESRIIYLIFFVSHSFAPFCFFPKQTKKSKKTKKDENWKKKKEFFVCVCVCVRLLHTSQVTQKKNSK